MVGVRVGTGVNVDQAHFVRVGVRVLLGVSVMVGISVGGPGVVVMTVAAWVAFAKVTLAAVGLLVAGPAATGRLGLREGAGERAAALVKAGGTVDSVGS
jgi:hypothetical protein